ncbi:molybdopterin-binding protein [Komagataeibacter rhaeticus]|nr:molybdopterin-binding protein [Komagataeibacter rhaeticus]
MSRLDMKKPFLPVRIAVLTVSDTRTPETDRSGDILAARITAAGHIVAARAIVPDDVPRLVATLSGWIADSQVDVVISTGGTGVTGRDITPEAFGQVIEKRIEGFGELFRMLSYQKIGYLHHPVPCPGGVADGTYLLPCPARPAR